jgi:subtilisin-like proprotein convertase family protein
MKKYALALFLALPAICLADRFEFSSQVNREIPDDDSTGIRDTIFIDQHIQIEDINIFVGISTEHGSAEEVMIDIFSPSRHAVRLNGWGGYPDLFWYYFWYDTDRPEDGPGELEDYAGTDAYGPWEMFCFDPFMDHSLFWYLWRIEIYGDLITGIEEDETLIPAQFEFKGVFPNPFNSTTSFKFGLPVTAEVTFGIYDIQGRRVKTIGCGDMPAGYHSIIWNGSNDADKAVASGIYFVTMRAGDKNFAKRALLLK